MDKATFIERARDLTSMVTTESEPVVQNMARLIDALLAQWSRGTPTTPESYGDMLFLAPRLALWKTRPVTLTISEGIILRRLVRAGGQTVSYLALYESYRTDATERVAAGNYSHEVTVRNVMKRLRGKFALIDKGFTAIGNVRSRGYRWYPERAQRR